MTGRKNVVLFPIALALFCIAWSALYVWFYNALYVHHVLTEHIRSDWMNLFVSGGVPFLVQACAIALALRAHLVGLAFGIVLGTLCALSSWLNVMLIACEPYAC
jgi:hypothetical protein